MYQYYTHLKAEASGKFEDKPDDERELHVLRIYLRARMPFEHNTMHFYTNFVQGRRHEA